MEDRRIAEAARFANLKFEIIALATVKGSAIVLESELLKLGVSPKYSGFNGASEFRALTDLERQTAIDLIRAYRDV